MNEKTLQQIVDGRIGGYQAQRILRYSALNPEQKLAHVLEMLVVEGKTKLALMEIAKGLAEECKAWRQTPEGQAWGERKRLDSSAAQHNSGASAPEPT